MTQILPAFSQLDLSTVEATISQHIENNRQALAVIKKSEPSWSGIESIEAMGVALSHYWSTVNHLHHVKSHGALRQVVETCLPKLVDYHTSIEQDEELYQYYVAVSALELTDVQRAAVEKAIRDFELSGVHLNQESKAKIKAIETKLSQCSNQFSQHVMDATDAFSHIVSKDMLEGVPENSQIMFQKKAEEKGKEGYCIGIDYPSFDAVIRFASNRSLRQTIYEAFVSKASDLGDPDKDNTALIQETLRLRHQLAQELGFENYAAYSVANKMAEKPEAVMHFLERLADLAKEKAKDDLKTVQAFAASHGQTEFAPWDYAYWSRLYKESLFDINDKAIREYFPLTQVMQGLFDIIETLYAIRLVEVYEFDQYHPDVRCFALQQNDTIQGYLIMDLFARVNKRGGAWMDECRLHHHLTGSQSLPVAYLVCNFEAPQQNKACHLSHGDVVTLFHEMGHCLHHLLTQIPIPSLSGINGVPWDAVELPSQFFENWAWSTEGLQRLTRCQTTNESMPKRMIEKLQKTRNYQEAAALCRQLEFALFDFKLHLSGQDDFISILNAVREQVRVLPVSEKDRFAHSFGHIFAGGYAAGYYSYKWAEVLAYDAFGAFEEEGIMNSETGARFKEKLLSQGGVKSPQVLFEDFRGRKVDESVMLKAQGICA